MKGIQAPKRFMSLAATLAAFVLAAAPSFANTYTVLNTADTGAGSLRQAITDANTNPGADTIAFNIPGAGVHTIAPASLLPKITGAVTVDGYSQPGSSANTNASNQGLNTVLGVEIDCTNGGTYCLVIGADDVTIRGLAMSHGATLIATDFFKNVQNPVVEGCFLGTTADGMTSVASSGVIIFGQHTNARIGGTTPAARNLLAGKGPSGQIQISFAANNGSSIQGNLVCTDKTGSAVAAGLGATDGILLEGGGSAGNTSNMTIGGLTPGAGNTAACSTSVRLDNMHDVRVQGNRFGVDVSESFAIGSNGLIGVYLNGGDNTVVIGGTAPGAGNVIGGVLRGIAAFSGTNEVIQGNFIGTDRTQTKDLGNSSEGIFVHATAGLTIGGTASGEPNAIMHNRGAGIRVECCGTGNKIRGNRISANFGNAYFSSSLGINLIGAVGPEPQDPGDPDTGGNDLQNSPLITSAVPEGGGTRVIGTLNSTASSSFTLDFYADPACHTRPRNQDQADQYLGSMPISTDPAGVASFNFLLPTSTVAGQPVTATATNAAGSTSELSPSIVFSSTPIAGSPLGGSAITIFGAQFTAGATVTVGGVPATNVQLVNNPTRLVADFPARPVGTVHDIVVTLPGGQTGTLRNGYVARFNDVLANFDDFVARLAANGITAGCGGGDYCTNSSVTRSQMAVFLLRSKNGVCYVPPPATGTVFTDVPVNGFAAGYIEALANGGVTGGCAPGLFCPTDPVTRAQMAVFLLRTLEGPSYLPPACTTATFTDMPCSSGFSRWVYELVRRNITAGCGGGNYCGTNNVTRGQMAVFMVATFGLT